MFGLLAALISSIGFAGNTVLIRRGVFRSGESFSPIPIAAFMGTIFFAVPIMTVNGTAIITSISWLGISALAAAGIVHFILGRFLSYISYRLIGANLSSPTVQFSTLIAVMLGILYFDEPLTVRFVLAFILITGGVIVIGTSGESKAGKLIIPASTLIKGVIAALGASICWGVSPALIKIGLREGSSDLGAISISYMASLIATAVLMAFPANREKVLRLDRQSLPFIIAGTASVTIAQFLRYIALNYAGIGVVTLTINIATVFIFPLSFFINRDIEVFSRRAILGAVACITGVVLLFLE